MAPARLVEIASEGKEMLDITALGSNRARVRLDHVVEAQPQPVTPFKGAERLGLGPAGIENGQDVGDPGLAMKSELIDPAHRYLIGHQLLLEEHPSLRSRFRVSPNMPDGCGKS